MQPTIQSQIQAYEDHHILKNFSLAIRKMYLRTLKSFLRFAANKHPRSPLNQELARKYNIYRHKKGSPWSTIYCDYSSLPNHRGPPKNSKTQQYEF